MLFVLLCTVAWSQRRLDLSGYTMVWNDEFDYTGTQEQIRDQMFNSTMYPKCKWINGFSWGDNTPSFNPQGHFGISRIDQMTVSNGVLYMKTQNIATGSLTTEDSQGDPLQTSNRGSNIMARYNHDYFSKMSWGTNPWDTTSSFHYGIFEIRAKLPASDYSGAGFWFWGHSDQGHNIYPSDLWCGQPPPNGTPCPPGASNPLNCSPGWELDAFEFVAHNSGTADDVFFSTIQPNPLITTPAPCTSCATWYDWLNSNPTQTFHTYTMAWTPTKMTWFIDGNEVRTQSDGIPPAKMDFLIGHFINYQETNGSTADGLPLAIDYARVYRPTPTNDFNYIIDYVNTGNINLTSSIWSNGYKSNVSGVDPQIVAYRNAYNNASSEYLKNENYRFFWSQTQLGTNIGNRVLDQSATGNRIYYTEGNALKRVLVPSTYDGVSPLVPENLNVNNASSLTSLSIDKLTNAVYYVSNDYKIWCYRKPGSIAYNAKLNTNVDIPVMGKLFYVTANTKHPNRIYFFTSVGCSPFPCFQTRIAYYEYCANDTKWYLHETNLTGSIGAFITGSPDGKPYFLLGNEMYNLWTYTTAGAACNGNSVTNWQYSPCGYFGDVSQSSNLAMSPDGNKYFYRTTSNGLAYRYWDGTGWQREIIKEVTDVGQGSIKVKNSQDGQRLEIFYVSIDNKLKTCYQRKAPLVNGKQVWQNSTLDVFSLTWQDANGTYQHTTAHDIQAQFDINAGYPNQIYVLKTDEKLGVYRYGTNWTGLLSPYTTCHDADEWHNGIEFKHVQPKEENNIVNIYPNPSDGQITLEIGGDIGQSDVEIYSLDGKLLQKESITSNKTTLNLRLENSGTYILRLTNNNQVHNQLFQIIK